MKKLLAIALLLPVFAVAQKKQPAYLMVSPGVYKYENNDVAPGIAVSFGARPKDISFGVGVGITSIKGTSGSAYIPLFVEIAILPKEKKVAPFISTRLGYGVYNSGSSLIKTSGGFYGNLNAGFSSRIKGNSRFILSIGYVRSEFVTDIKSGSSTKSTSSSLNGFTVTIGFVI